MPLTTAGLNALQAGTLYSASRYLHPLTTATTPQLDGTGDARVSGATSQEIPTAGWTTASGGARATNADESFAAGSFAGETVRGIGLYDDASGTTLLGWADFASAVTLTATDALTVSSGWTITAANA